MEKIREIVNLSFLARFTLVIAVILLIIFLPYWFNTGALVHREGDYKDLVWPDYLFVKESIVKDKEIPLWNPYVLSGIPEVANPQSPLIYPPNLISVILPTGLSIILLTYLHLIFAAFFLFLLANKKLKWNNTSSIVTAIVYILSPYIWGKISVGHISHVFAYSLIPAIIYFSFNYYKEKKVKDLLLISLVLSLVYLNYPTLWFYTILFGGICYLYMLVNNKELKKSLLLLTAPIFSLLFISPLFFVQLQASNLITRSELRFEDLAIPIWSIKRFILSITLPPTVTGDLETEVWLFPGLSVLVLSAISFLKIKKHKLILACLVIFILLITLGKRTPVFELLVNYFPGFSYLRVTTRDWFVFILILAFLTGGLFEYKFKYKKVLICIIFFELFIFSFLRLVTYPVFGTSFNTNYLVNFNDPQYRVYCTSRCISPKDLIEKNIKSADGYHLLILKGYRDKIAEAGGFKPPKYTGNIPGYEQEGAQPDAVKLGEFSIKWVISKYPLTDQSFIQIDKKDNYYIYENLKALPRIRIMNGNNKIEVVRDSINQIIIKTNGSETLLVIADSYFPGWYATIDNKDVKLDIYNGWARSIEIPEGEHTIKLKYNPFKL